VFGHGEGEQHVLDLLRRRLTAGDDLQVGEGLIRLRSRDWTRKPPATERNTSPGQRVGQAVGQQQAQVLLGGEDRAGFLVGAGGDDDLGEDVGDQRVGAVQGRLTAMTPPKAETASHSSARA
jgi:hypothetical protein